MATLKICSRVSLKLPLCCNMRCYNYGVKATHYLVLEGREVHTRCESCFGVLGHSTGVPDQIIRSGPIEDIPIWVGLA